MPNEQEGRGPASLSVWILTLLLFAVVVNIAAATFVRQERRFIFALLVVGDEPPHALDTTPSEVTLDG